MIKDKNSAKSKRRPWSASSKLLEFKEQNFDSIQKFSKVFEIENQLDQMFENEHQ